MGERNVIKIVLFSGGRGTGEISKYLLDRLQVRLTLLVNAYDDGLSTGRLRAFIPGMLGPSDIRKNIALLMDTDDQAGRSLKQAYELRFPDRMEQERALACLRSLAAVAPESNPLPELATSLAYLPFFTLKDLAADAQAFLDYCERRGAEGVSFDFGDCSLGNILFSGRYLRVGQDFNRTCHESAQLCSCKAEVLNVTDGKNLVLTAVKEDGTYLSRESEIVAKQQSQSPIRELFLLPDYLTVSQREELGTLDLEKKQMYLRGLEVFPALNPLVRERLAEADMIIYGPGTQHSSLLPSYMTRGLSEAVFANERAVKVFVSNVAKDHDIQLESVDSLLGKFAFYSSRKGALPGVVGEGGLAGLVTHAFIQRDVQNDRTRLHYYTTNTSTEASSDAISHMKKGLGLSEVFIRDWEDAPGHHHGYLIERELLGLVERQPSLADRLSGKHLLSIVVLAQNEAHTVERVLRDLQAEDTSLEGVAKEVILVDGGSSDGTPDIAAHVQGVRVVRLPLMSGFGESLRAGIRECRGSIVATFPADGEYLTSELMRAVRPVLRGDAMACFGSRMMKCINLDDVLRRIYGNRRLLYLLSKYGGLALSLVSFLRHGQFLSDPLTSVRVFDYKFLRSLQLSGSSFNIIGEIIGKTCVRQQRIFEVPVSYMPRSLASGKKMSIRTGLGVLRALSKRYRAKIGSNA